MRAGQLRTRLTVETRDAASLDALNAPAAKAWSFKGKVWGKVTTANTAKILEAGKALGQYTHILTIRKPSFAITVQDRFKMGSRYLYVVAPPENTDQRNERLVITVKEDANA